MNRQTNRRALDDLPLETLPERPLHLVCCAANDLSGDPIETLGRGARSRDAVANGVAMGNGALRPVALTLGGAITASAAAFNSNMGSVSMSVGPVVAFLMSAFEPPARVCGCRIRGVRGGSGAAIASRRAVLPRDVRAHDRRSSSPRSISPTARTSRTWPCTSSCAGIAGTSSSPTAARTRASRSTTSATPRGASARTSGFRSTST